MARRQNRQRGQQGGGGGRPITLTIQLDGTGADSDKIAQLQPYGFFPLEVPAHTGVELLNFLSRFENWTWNSRKQEYQLKTLTYTVGDVLENLFLAFYRLVPREPDSDAYSEHKAQYLKALEARWTKSGVGGKMAEQVYERQHCLLEALHTEGWKVWCKELVTDARLIVGLGYKGALEVGLTLHPLYGFPYLPGTAVKGIARAYAELVVGQELKAAVKTADDDAARREVKRKLKAHKRLMRLIFGSPDKFKDEPEKYRVGCVRFFDALPISFPELKVDVMTPHFGDYYMDLTGRIAPGDWHSPVPVAFLTVAEEQPFHFFLAAQGDAEIADSDECLLKASSWLEAGLKNLGAGGKTAAGYGRFLSVEERKAEKEKLIKKAEALKAEEKARQKEEERKRAEQAVTWIETITKTTDGVYAKVVGHKGRTNIVTLYVRDQEGRHFEVGGGTFVEGTILTVQVIWSKKSKKIAQVGASRTVSIRKPS